MATNRTVKVYETIVDTAQLGPMEDGTAIYRFRTQAAADQFVAGKTYYGRPAKVSESDVPVKIARRWGMA